MDTHRESCVVSINLVKTSLWCYGAVGFDATIQILEPRVKKGCSCTKGFTQKRSHGTLVCTAAHLWTHRPGTDQCFSQTRSTDKALTHHIQQDDSNKKKDNSEIEFSVHFAFELE